ncbi:MAG: hypothetical protein HQL38_10825 [Alphaproteobacteria bacterium]|nr:hypothetical protein [Alphaproteobacteria bacterium]
MGSFEAGHEVVLCMPDSQWDGLGGTVLVITDDTTAVVATTEGVRFFPCVRLHRVPNAVSEPRVA